RLDDERGALPVAAGVAHVELEVVARVRTAVEWNDARLVHHLVANRDPALALHDLVGVAVDRRHHRSGQPARDAAIVQAAILVGIGRTACARAARFGARGLAPPALFRDR